MFVQEVQQQGPNTPLSIWVVPYYKLQTITRI